MTYYLTDRYAIPVPELDQAMKISSTDLPLLANRVDEVLGGVADAVEAVRTYEDPRLGQIRVGKNLWDPQAVEDGMILKGGSAPDGTTAPSAPYQTSGRMPVTAGQPYTLWGEGATGVRGPHSWAFYDRAGAFLTYHVDTAMVPQTLTPTQDGYLRASFRTEIISAPMVEAGTEMTAYEPFTITIPNLAFSLSATDIPAGVISPEKTSFARTGKNILDPALFEADAFLNSGATVTLAGYTTSGLSAVEAGESYVGVVRLWAWYRADGSYIGGRNTGSNTDVSVETAPADAAYLRASWSSTRDAVQQIEKGTTPTAFERFGVLIPNLITDTGGGGEAGGASGPLTVTATTAGIVNIRSGLGGGVLTVTSDLYGSRNGAFNFLGVDYGGTAVSAGADDIAPLRTFNTVGANHGYTAITTLTAPGHGKTGADLGSVWTDGVIEWTLLVIDGDDLTVGPDYSIDGAGVATAPAAPPAGPLTHVSGATDTTGIPVDQVIAGAQLYPSVQRVHSTLLVDGTPIGEGEHHGVTAQVRESYEVLDYASIIDTAQANIGTPFHEVRVAGAVRVENTYTFKPGLVLVDTALTELRPTSLGSCGFVQAIRPAGTGGRIVPGVTGWTTPRSFADTWTSEVITASDLIDPTIPPVMSLDVMDWGGFALGYFPHAGGVTSSAERIEHGASRLWDLRSTQKSYPSPWAAKAAGWGRVEAHAYRAYLTPAQAGAVAAVAEDAHAAHSALASVTGL